MFNREVLRTGLLDLIIDWSVRITTTVSRLQRAKCIGGLGEGPSPMGQDFLDFHFFFFFWNILKICMLLTPHSENYGSAPDLIHKSLNAL